MTVVAGILGVAAIAALAYTIHVLLGTVQSLTAEVTRVIGRVTANDPVQTVDEEGVIRQDPPTDPAGFMQYLVDNGLPDPDDRGSAYVDPTDLDLPDPAEYDASNRVIMGDDPTWPKFDD